MAQAVTILPEKGKGAAPRTVTHSEARASANWATKTLAAEVG